MDYALSKTENGSKWMWLLERLDRAADDRQIFGHIPARNQVVGSRASIDAFIELYRTALIGKTYICAGISGAGKTTAAHYLLHGDFTLRPQRGILIRADSFPNFEEDFARYLNADEAAPLLYLLLSRALTPKYQREQAVLPRGLGPTFDLLKSTVRSSIRACGAMSFETNPVQLSHGKPMKGKSRFNCTNLPILIIDGLVKSEANKNFVNKLYNEAYQAKIMVLILVKDPSWGAELISMNGGTHILPVDGVISNPRISLGKPFTDIPQWNMMKWTEEDLLNFANLVGIPAVHVVEGMTPQQLLDLQDGDDLKEGDDDEVVYGF